MTEPMPGPGAEGIAPRRVAPEASPTARNGATAATATGAALGNDIDPNGGHEGSEAEAASDGPHASFEGDAASGDAASGEAASDGGSDQSGVEGLAEPGDASDAGDDGVARRRRRRGSRGGRSRSRGRAGDEPENAWDLAGPDRGLAELVDLSAGDGRTGALAQVGTVSSDGSHDSLPFLPTAPPGAPPAPPSAPPVAATAAPGAPPVAATAAPSAPPATGTAPPSPASAASAHADVATLGRRREDAAPSGLGLPPAPDIGPNGVERRRPRIGDTRPAPPTAVLSPPTGATRAPRPPGDRPVAGGDDPDDPGRKRRRRAAPGRPTGPGGAGGGERPGRAGAGARREEARRDQGDRSARQPVEMVTSKPLTGDDPEAAERRRGRERNGRPVGRYSMVVHTQPQATQIAVLEGRVLIEHYVSRPQDDANQIDGNIYVGRIETVLPGMEAAFVEIGTPKNAVLYRGDVRFDTDDVDRTPGGRHARDAVRIEQLLRPGQVVVCQVTKNPIAHKGARLTQEVSLPGRFVVLIPNSTTFGISKRLADNERRRLRAILDAVKPGQHGLIVRTAAEGASADELRRDVVRLVTQWERIEALAQRTRGPGLIYREPDLAVRVIREEFNKEYRNVAIDDLGLYEEVRDYVASISPELADRIEYYAPAAEGLPLFERHRVHEQLHRAIDRKVWLPSGGSLIIERTEALCVIDVNTAKNVGVSNLEETVYRNNLEAADEIARQLRLRDIGGIIVIDFIDMEISANRADVVRVLREALARDKTRTQVFDVSELGLVEMSRKRVSEGLVESLSSVCPTCEGRGILFDARLLD